MDRQNCHGGTVRQIGAQANTALGIFFIISHSNTSISRNDKASCRIWQMLMAPETGKVYRTPTAERLKQFSTCIHAMLASTIGYGFWFIFLVFRKYFWSISSLSVLSQTTDPNDYSRPFFSQVCCMLFSLRREVEIYYQRLCTAPVLASILISTRCGV